MKPCNVLLFCLLGMLVIITLSNVCWARAMEDYGGVYGTQEKTDTIPASGPGAFNKPAVSNDANSNPTSTNPNDNVPVGEGSQPAMPAEQTPGQFQVTTQKVDFYPASAVTEHGILGVTYGGSFNNKAKNTLPKGAFVQIVEDTAARVTDTGGLPGVENVTKVNVIQGDAGGNPYIAGTGYIKTGVWEGSGLGKIEPPGSLTILRNVNPGNPDAPGTLLQLTLWGINQQNQK